MRFLKKFFITLLILALIIIGFLIYFKFAVTISPPVPDNLDVLNNKRTELEKDFFVCKNNWLRHSKSGLWEMYIEGGPFERGVMNGILAKELIYLQEELFVNELKKMVSSESYLHFLKYLIAWFNKDLDKYISKEYQLEIFGISEFSSEDFNNVGPKYLRFLNYHAAHDIGHALENMDIVRCTSFATWGDASEDSLLIVGRNFDFHVGDDFSKEKIIAFYNPDQGHKFMFVTWGGMIGVLSGMNEKGLTVTVNSAKSDMPLRAKTPISILAREILQYAQNIDEAYDIAKKNETFVNESILIGSAQDNRAVIIEKSTEKTAMFDAQDNKIICSNHYQCSAFANDNLNVTSIQTSSSSYRYQRVQELINELQPINYKKAAEILRNKKGLKGKDIGLGNEKSINQLIAHHSIIFIPAKQLVWVSTNPYQLGQYVAYDLKKVFENYKGLKKNIEINEPDLSIQADSFLFSKEYKNYEFYRRLKASASEKISCKDCEDISEEEIAKFISLNPEYFYVYELVGDYFFERKQYDNAVKYYEWALTKEITTTNDVNRIKTNLAQCTPKK